MEHPHHLIKRLMEHSLNLEDLGLSLITIALKRANHHIDEAARRLGLTRFALGLSNEKICGISVIGLAALAVGHYFYTKGQELCPLP